MCKQIFLVHLVLLPKNNKLGRVQLPWENGEQHNSLLAKSLYLNNHKICLHTLHL